MQPKDNPVSIEAQSLIDNKYPFIATILKYAIYGPGKYFFVEDSRFLFKKARKK